jgi:hypothetical protein
MSSCRPSPSFPILLFHEAHDTYRSPLASNANPLRRPAGGSAATSAASPLRENQTGFSVCGCSSAIRSTLADLARAGLQRDVSFGWQATRTLSTVARSAKVDHQLESDLLRQLERRRQRGDRRRLREPALGAIDVGRLGSWRSDGPRGGRMRRPSEAAPHRSSWRSSAAGAIGRTTIGTSPGHARASKRCTSSHQGRPT